MRLRMLTGCLLLLLLTPGRATAQRKDVSLPRHKATKAIFVFHTDEFWLNLHHFLYVLGRAQNKTRDSSRAAVAGAPNEQEQGLAQLPETDRLIWREAVSSYAAGLSKKDLIFDDPLPAITNALAGAGDALSLSGTKIDASLVALLERAAPVY